MNSLVGIVQRALDPWLFLNTAEAASRALTPSRRARVVALRKAGDARSDAALGERGLAALILARDAIPRYLAAIVTARADEPPPEDASLQSLWNDFDALVAGGLTAPVPPALEPARRHATSRQPPDDEIAQYGERRVEDALALGQFLARSVEVRTPLRIRVERVARTVSAAVLVVVAVAETIIHRPWVTNLALHAAVVTSSRRPGSGPPQDLTNGKVEPTLAFATKDEADPWVTVDLGVAQRVSRITLVNSDDHQDDSLPLRVETSADGARWEAAGTQTAHFTHAQPAVLSFTTRAARFVRIHGRTGGAIYLNEVEVR